eukprot:790420-Rhodomonas_salina.2
MARAQGCLLSGLNPKSSQPGALSRMPVKHEGAKCCVPRMLSLTPRYSIMPHVRASVMRSDVPKPERAAHSTLLLGPARASLHADDSVG